MFDGLVRVLWAVGMFILGTGLVSLMIILCSFLVTMTRRICKLIRDSIDKPEEPVKGLWLNYMSRSDASEWFYCTECQCLNKEASKFCPHCGSRMKKKHE